MSELESFGSGACVKLRLSVVKSPDICPPKGVACAPFAGGLRPMRRYRDLSTVANVEQLLGEGLITQDETTQVGARA